MFQNNVQKKFNGFFNFQNFHQSEVGCGISFCFDFKNLIQFKEY